MPASTKPSARPAPGMTSRSSVPGATRDVISYLARPGRPDAGSAARKKPVVTNHDKKDSIRERMADTGEPFNVARRKIEEAASGQTSDDADPYELIEVEVGDQNGPPRGAALRRHTESFWGRWIIKPDPDTTGTIEPGHPEGAYYGVAQARRGRIAVYTAMSNPLWPGRLEDYDTLDEAGMPADIRGQAAKVLGTWKVIHRDI